MQGIVPVDAIVPVVLTGVYRQYRGTGTNVQERVNELGAGKPHFCAHAGFFPVERTVHKYGRVWPPPPSVVPFTAVAVMFGVNLYTYKVIFGYRTFTNIYLVRK